MVVIAWYSCRGEIGLVGPISAGCCKDELRGGRGKQVDDEVDTQEKGGEIGGEIGSC